MKLRGTAPMRIDLAGGTLDIYPLYIFEGGGLTLNAAITLTSEVSLETLETSEIKIISEDLGIEVSAPDVDSLDPSQGLDLLVRIIKFYRPPCGFVVSTKNHVPKGSGLGASSSLLITLSHTLNRLLPTPLTNDQIIDYGANIEAESIRVPTGMQDYFSATYGGVSTIWFDARGARREQLISSEETLQSLEKRLVVSFAGAPRFSGMSNWHMMRGYIDGDTCSVHNIGMIKKTALQMRTRLSEGDLDSFGALLAEEWNNRKNLADGVTNETIDSLMEKAAAAGAEASKICGAGGGGCMISFCSPGAREAVETALRNAGANVLDCSISRTGVEVVEL